MNKPWWLEAVLKVGIPSAIAVYLIWFMTTKMDGKADTTIQLIQNHNLVMEKSIRESENQTNILQRMLQINQEQCINQAVTAKRNARECLK